MKRVILGVLAAGVVLLAGCSDTGPVGGPPGEEPVQEGVDLIVPRRVPAGAPVPAVIRCRGENPRSGGWETFQLSAAEASLDPPETVVKRGWGSAKLTLGGSGEVTLQAMPPSGTGAVTAVIEILGEEFPAREISGALSGAGLAWDSTAIIRLTGHTAVPAGAQLTIGPGTRVELEADVRLDVNGAVFCGGTAEAPVVFAPRRPDQPWGEVNHDQGRGDYTYTFFTGGGGDAGRSFGHSGSQPVLRGVSSFLRLDHVYFLDNPGKALGMVRSTLLMDDCLVSRCDTGGELVSTEAVIDRCAWIDIPSGDTVEVDDDNDALYLSGYEEGANATLIANSVFVSGKDDGIDHNGAEVVVDNCVIEDFDNEGVAASNRNRIEITNTLILGCEQGIEAGYGSPEVVVNHCVIVGCDTGLRFGDWYDLGCTGTLDVLNTISDGNHIRNAWNYDLSLDGPREGAVTITYSIVNVAEYDGGEGCLTGDVSFDGEYLLLPDSPGIGAASDGLDMGLLPLP